MINHFCNNISKTAWMQFTFYSPNHIISIYIINASSTPIRFSFAECIKHQFTFIAKNQDKLVSAKAKNDPPAAPQKGWLQRFPRSLISQPNNSDTPRALKTADKPNSCAQKTWLQSLIKPLTYLI